MRVICFWADGPSAWFTAPVRPTGPSTMFMVWPGELGARGVSGSGVIAFKIIKAKRVSEPENGVSLERGGGAFCFQVRMEGNLKVSGWT